MTEDSQQTPEDTSQEAPQDTPQGASATSFLDAFQLEASLQKAIQAVGYKSWTPIQERCLPLILSGQDVAGLAQTGTGKTAAFLIPLIERVLRSRQNEGERIFNNWNEKSFVLVLVPTRELVTQVHDNIQKLTQGTGLTAVYLYGGVGYEEQISSLKKPFQFLVATPGRLIDLYKEHHLDLKQVRAAVFDEADRMFDMGFQQDVLYILRRIPEDRQLLLFSATLNLTVTQMAYGANSNPVEVDVSRDQVSAGNVDDKMFHVSQNEKPQFLLSILKKYTPQQVIIFSNFKNKVPRIADFLNNNGFPALGISSLLSQAQRNRVIEKFKSSTNKNNILVATDVAARGLDIKGVDLVINFELPDDAENYVHRIGRTGRADHKGEAFSLVCDKDVESLMRIEEYLKEKVEVIWLEDGDLVKEFQPMGEDDYRDSHALRKKEMGRPPRGPRREFREGGRNDRPRREGERDGSRIEGAGESRREGGSMHRDRRTGRHDRHKSKDMLPGEATHHEDSGSRSSQQRHDGPRRGSGSAQGRHSHRDTNNSARHNGGGHGAGHSGDHKNQSRSGSSRQRFSKNNSQQNRHEGSRSHGSSRHGNNRPNASVSSKSSSSLWGKIKTSVKKWMGA